MNTAESQVVIHGFNYLRVVGVAFVVLQHQLSVLSLDEFSSFYGLSVGQVGVAIFLAVSGSLALVGNRTAWDWLFARFIRIYPAYWIVTILSFVATWMSGYRSFGPLQVVSQLIGTGLFTHPNNLVNVATWFVSLLLALYLIVFFARLVRLPDFVIVFAAVVAIGLGTFGISKFLAAHATTFLISCWVFRGATIAWRRLLTALLILLLFILFGEQKLLVYSVIALLSVVGCHTITSTPLIVNCASKYSYEFYLCHGIFLVGSQSLIKGMRLVSVPVGLITSVVASVVLHRVTMRLMTRISKQHFTEQPCSSNFSSE